MSLTYGFYNSLNGDRRYDAIQMSSLFDGLINDGIYASIGDAFVVRAAGGLNITVGSGRAWFNHTWTLNDTVFPLTAPASEVVLNRIDAVVLEVDATASVRANAIKIIQGTPATTPVRPTLVTGTYVNQHVLCYIYRAANSLEITQSDITNMIGTASTPFVTGIVQVVSLDQLLGQWQDQLDRFVASKTDENNQWMASEQAKLDAWLEQRRLELTAEKEFLDQWILNEQNDFLAWYQRMKDQLDEDSAGKLQLQIDKEEVKRILIVGFVDGEKTFSDDGTVIVSTASDGRTLTKTFTNSFLTMTNVLKSSNGAEVAKMVKNFDSSGKLIDTVVTYL